MNRNWIGPALDVRALFPLERAHLLELLASLEPAEWRRPTACPGWSVHDLVAHLAHDYLRRLSGMRDRHAGPGFEPGEDLPAFITRVNEEFVATARRFSPEVLMEVLAHFGPQLDGLWAELDLDTVAALDVAWADPGVPAPVWLDVAREFSEFWIHQQQLRDAVGRAGANDPGMVEAIVDTLVRGLPLALREHPAPVGTTVNLRVSGEADRSWAAICHAERWYLEPWAGQAPVATVEVSADTLWRVASRGIEPEEAIRRARLSGDLKLCRAALGLLSIIR